MTEEKMIEEILWESASVGMKSEVIDRAHDIMGSSDFQKNHRKRGRTFKIPYKWVSF